ncbi:MAG: sulfatase [Akkermansiaceae bacterium]|nr:sulfatase [Akkermansiaceae bacterium]
MKAYLFVILLLLVIPATATPKPNIIIFYVDDLGWQDVQLNDVDQPCPYETPHVKKLAEAGMNFPQAYSAAPTCAPSRAGIMTGQHPAKIGLTHVDLAVRTKPKKDQRLVSPYLQSPLDLNLLTLADALKANGYRTGHSGKWHCGSNAASYGFDVVSQDRGVHRGMGDRTKDFATAKDRKYPLSKEKYFPTSKKKPEGISYPYDEVTESALDFIEKSKGEPFFLNLCHWMVHWPMLTRNGELLEYYCDKFSQPFPPKPGAMTLPGQQNPYFASMVTTVDWSLGRLVDYLEKTEDPRNPGKKLSETTYIFFTSDNGGAEIKGKEILSDNAPLKYGKKHAEEGGIRVPMVVTGPGIKQGSRFDGMVNQLDYFPTILKLTGSKIDPADAKELSGLDISPVLEGKAQKIVDAKGVERDHLFWHFPHNNMKSAIRSGDFKLYKRYNSDDYELYQLTKNGKRNDYEEVHDLARNPEFRAVVERLSKTLEAELVANHAEGPYLNPVFEDKKTAAAVISTPQFNSASRVATISVGQAGPTITTAYVIYLSEKKEKKEKRDRNMVGVPDDAKLPGMRAIATISADGRSVSAAIPAGIHNCCFVVIDSNGYMTYTKEASTQ